MKERSEYAVLDVIRRVIESLDLLDDIVRCSAVCKTWRAAYQQLHPASVVVYPNFHTPYGALSPDGLVRVVKWFQLKTKAGCLDSLQRLTVRVSDDNTTDACRQKHRLQQFSQSLLSLAGLWHLQSLDLDLHSPLETAAALLPPSLRRLELSVHTKDLPALVSMAMFEGLKGLEELDLQMWLENVVATQLESQQTCGFILNAQLNALTHLKLSPGPVRMPADSTLSCFMPSLRHMNVFVNAPHAQSLIDLASLHTLTLNVLCFPEPGLHYRDPLEISASCHLCFLCLRCPADKGMTLLVNKACVQYRTEGIHVVATPLTNLHGEQSDLLMFHELD